MLAGGSSIEPNFFIIGAPKSGTTALYEYLKSHPRICLSKGKEPHYFCSDFPGYQWSKTKKAYLENEFEHCTCEQDRVGEASVWYMYSRVAVANIKKFNSDAKIIVILRHPVDMLHSLHSQMYYNMDEDEPDFGKAWALQYLRKNNKKIPKYCRERQFLQYGNIGRFGEQLTRLYDTVDRDQVLVVFLEDMQKSALDVYKCILMFLKLPYDGKKEFPIINENKVYRSKSLQILLQTESMPGMKIVKTFYEYAGINRIGLMRLLNYVGNKYNSRKVERAPISPDFRAQLVEYFHDDIRLTENLLLKDLTHWLE